MTETETFKLQTDIPKNLHRALKVRAAEKDKLISELVAEIIETYFEKENEK